jgi:peptide-methionine (S)-S-oxide reductase
MSLARRSLLALIALPLALTLSGSGARAASTETAVLAGGCFWGMEAVFGALKGVVSSTPGYAGGKKETAHYDLVSTGTTGHAESVRVVYDPTKITYERILDVYFQVAHDPTELNRQGPDEGTQYRSTIFAANDDQRHRAEAVIKKYTAAHRFPAPIVTTIETLHGFYPAEAEHLNFVKLHPDYPYVLINDLPKLAALHHTFPALVKS